MKTKIFIDSIDLEEIKFFNEKINIHGVTTNPTLAKRFNMSDDIDMVKKINAIIPNKEIHVEAFGDTSKEIVENALRIQKKCKGINLVFKIPFSVAGTEATKKLIAKSLKTSLHLIYSVNQALLAATVESTYICPLIGRLDDIGHKAFENLKLMRSCFDNNKINTKIMGSSIRNPQHVINAFELNLEAITIPLSVIRQMFDHPLTNLGYLSFQNDYKNLSKISSCKIHRNLIIDEKNKISELLSMLATNRAGAVAIKNQRGRLTGIFTTGDLKRLINKGIDLNQNITKYMSKNVISVEANETVNDVVKLVKEKNLSQLVVLDNQNILGILESKDLL